MAEVRLAANILTPEVRRVPGMLAWSQPLETVLPLLHEMGYTGVELITTDPGQLDGAGLDRLLKRHHLRAEAINTGRICGELGLTLSHPDREIRVQAEERMADVIRFASRWGIPVNVGIVRGQYLPDVPQSDTYAWTVEALGRLGELAQSQGVTLVLETVCASMTNFLNTLQEAAALAADVDSPGLGVMYDVYQMALEEPDLLASIPRYTDLCRHVHLSDRQRKIPGSGGLDFPAIIAAINEAGYRGPYSIEIAMEPDAETAHRQAADYLLPLLRHPA